MTLNPHLQSLALALLHFLWQGALLGGLAALAFRLAAGRSPQSRYLLGLGFMGLALLSPLLTWAWLDRGLPIAAALGEPELTFGSAQALQGPSLGTRLTRALPWVLGAWSLGATLLALRLAGGWWWLQRLKARMEPVGAEWEARIRALARRMGLTHPFRVGLSRDITSPLVIGWIRPVLLIPAGLLTGMDPAALEALLAHEVAHLRRHDVLFNWLQCAVEVLLFYHPAVWWISKRTRFERECCCDDAAVADCGDPLRYAESLDRLDDLQSLDLIPAQAAHGANLMHRITRLLTPKTPTPRLPLALLLALVGAGTLALSARGAKAQATPVASAPSAPVASAPAHAATPKPSARAAKASPAPQGTPAPRAEAAPLRRSLTFELSVMKNEPTRLDFRAENATRAEVEAALSRIEALAEGIRAQGENRPSVKARWELKAPKGASEELLSFILERVSPAEARRLF